MPASQGYVQEANTQNGYMLQNIYSYKMTLESKFKSGFRTPINPQDIEKDDLSYLRQMMRNLS